MVITRVHTADLFKCYDEVIGQVRASLEKDPFGCLLILPSPMAVEQVNDRLLNDIGALLGDPVTTLKKFASSTFESVRTKEVLIEDPTVELIIADLMSRKVTEDSVLAGMLRDREHWAPEVRELFYTLERYRLDYPACLGDECRPRQEALGALYREYLKTLKDNELVDEVGVYDIAIQAIKARKVPVPKRLFLFGLTEMSPIEWTLTNALCGSSDEVDMYAWEHRGSSAFIDVSTNLTVPVSRSECESGDVPGISFDPSINVHASVDMRYGELRDEVLELRTVAGNIRDLLDEGVRPTDIAVLVPDRAKMMQRIEDVLDDVGVPTDVHYNGPLVSSALVQVFLHIGEVILNDHPREGLMDLISSPYITLSDDEGHRVSSFSIRHEVRRCKGLIGGKDQWLDFIGRTIEGEDHERRLDKERARQALIRLFRTLERLDGDMTPSDRSRTFRTVIGELGIINNLSKYDTRTFENESSALQAFFGVLDDIELGDRLCPGGAERLERFQMRLVMACTATTYRRGGTHGGGVTVAGLRSAHLARFDHVFIVGVVDGDMPFISRSRPLVPEEDAYRMGLLTLYDQLRQERSYFLTALASARRSLAVSVHQSEGERRKVPSHFYKDYKEVASPKEMAAPSVHRSKELSQVSLGGHMTGKDAIGWSGTCHLPAPLEDVRERMNAELILRCNGLGSEYGGVIGREDLLVMLRDKELEKRNFSSSSLDNLHDCGFRYFMKHILKVDEEEHLDEGSDSSGFGRLFHRIVKRFYEAHPGRVTVSDVEVAKVLIKDIARSEVDNEWTSGLRRDAWLELLTSSGGLLDAFLDSESKNKSPLVPDPCFLEYHFGVRKENGGLVGEPLRISLNDKISINVVGDIDRVDVGYIDGVDGDSFFLFDYKTGNPDNIPNSIQLPLYVMAMERRHPEIRCVGASFYSTERLLNGAKYPYAKVIACNETKKLILPKMAPGISPKDIDKELGEIKKLIIDDLGLIRSGTLIPQPRSDTVSKKQKTCKYCTYRRICRYRDAMNAQEVSSDGSDDQ